MKMPFAMPSPQTAPGYNMQAKMQNVAHDPKVPHFGIHGPWSISSGNVNYPNHRPFLTNIKPQNEGAPTPSAAAPKIV